MEKLPIDKDVLEKNGYKMYRDEVGALEISSYTRSFKKVIVDAHGKGKYEIKLHGFDGVNFQEAFLPAVLYFKEGYKSFNVEYNISISETLEDVEAFYEMIWKKVMEE